MKAKLIIPTSLSEIKLKEYQQFMLIQDKKDDKGFMLEVIRTFAKGDLDAVERFPVSKIEEIYLSILTLLQSEENALKRVININGVEYGFHPDLQELTIGEFSDIEEFIKQGYSQNIHKILAVLYRPVNRKHGKLYGIEPYSGTGKRPDIFLDHFPVDALHGVFVFFSIIENESMMNILSSLSKQEIEKLFKPQPQ